jgi:hypothetical protein
MKTIFIFDDSRPTDALHRIVALGEDGQRLAAVMFDGWMLPHCRYAMAALHTSDVNHDNVDAVRKTRSSSIEKFDAAYGLGAWVAVWLESPKRDDLWLEALQLSRERDARIEAVAVGFSSAALSRILGAVFGTPDVQPHTTH